MPPKRCNGNTNPCKIKTEMRQIINHLTDNDAYTFSCQYYVLQTYPRAEVEYTFFDRNGTIYPFLFQLTVSPIKTVSYKPALTRILRKQYTVVLSGAVSSIPNPTKRLKERLLLTKFPTSSLLKSC